jgi:hypothetical protein
MNQEVASRLDDYVHKGWEVGGANEYDGWIRRLLAFIRVAVSQEQARILESLGGDKTPIFWQSYRDLQCSHLEGLAVTLRAGGRSPEHVIAIQNVHFGVREKSTTKVFVVHGHDLGVKESVARLLERLNLNRSCFKNSQMRDKPSSRNLRTILRFPMLWFSSLQTISAVALPHQPNSNRVPDKTSFSSWATSPQDLEGGVSAGFIILG